MVLSKIKKSILLFIISSSIIFVGCASTDSINKKEEENSSNVQQKVDEEEVTIENTYKSQLESVILKAWDLYNSSTEGSNSGQYKSGAKATLLEAINKAEKIYNDKTKKQSDIDDEVMYLSEAINIFKSEKVSVSSESKSIESKILGKYTYNFDGGISKFTKNKIIAGWQYSESADATILSKREEGNVIYYSTDIGDIKIEIIDDSTIRTNGYVESLLTTQQLLTRIYEARGPEYVSYDALMYWGITQQDINTFYANNNY